MGLFDIREDVDVRFPRPGKPIPDSISCIETERQMKDMEWKKEKILEDMKREKTLLDVAKMAFSTKKNEFLKFLAESSSHATQVNASGLKVYLNVNGCLFMNFFFVWILEY